MALARQAPEEMADAFLAGLEQAGEMQADLQCGEPWSKVKEYRWDRLAVELLHKGYTSQEIAQKTGTGITEKRVNNRLSELRRVYGAEIVPHRKKGLQKAG